MKSKSHEMIDNRYKKKCVFIVMKLINELPNIQVLAIHTVGVKSRMQIIGKVQYQ